MMKFKLFLTVFLCSLFLIACQPEPVLLSGDILFEDDFSTRENQWTSLVNDGGVMNYDASGFRFYIKDAGLNYWATPGMNFNDVRVEVDALQYTGPIENRIGVICRYQNDQNFYFFVISADGYYAIGKMKAGELRLLGQDSMLYSSAIITGVAINHLRAECHGNTLRFYINDSPIALVEDFDFTVGDVGLLAGTFEEGGLDVLFDEFVVFQP
ncbi:MAG: hypothetical protein HN736_06075 [Anaerolineae bacterium]|jgi:hypothetical protein|nr:hypothetical protein [Anaerolineae bacterium]MBT3713682.1 hypothetical protein [Anaerolineae bacterium]MBT4310307.1 hypothetical protein [Anaerolineae bacterium]MBT4459766.1 hypothetical protein [Anaerolineae bacterium]MBT4840939.1 hypothetical protein [Anaerolineae bacterium]